MQRRYYWRINDNSFRLGLLERTLTTVARCPPEFHSAKCVSSRQAKTLAEEPAEQRLQDRKRSRGRR